MTIEVLRAMLGWAAIFNLAMVSLWFFLFLGMHERMYTIHGRWFPGLKIESFDAIHYAGMAWYKISTWLFFIMPYLALRLVA
jgi:hypothetical protein